MAKTYSYDLNQKVLANYFAGTPKIDIIRIFQLGMDTLNRWIRLFLPTGDVKLQTQTKFRPRKFTIGPDWELLNAWV